MDTRDTIIVCQQQLCLSPNMRRQLISCLRFTRKYTSQLALLCTEPPNLFFQFRNSSILGIQDRRLLFPLTQAQVWMRNCERKTSMLQEVGSKDRNPQLSTGKVTGSGTAIAAVSKHPAGCTMSELEETSFSVKGQDSLHSHSVLGLQWRCE